MAPTPPDKNNRICLRSLDELLVVTKPHCSCVQRIVGTFGKQKSQIRFRLTIGSADSEVLKLWEPGAPDFSERLRSLEYAYENGYSTSISCEPLLDDSFDSLYEKISPYVTDTIWVGKMNMASKRVRTNTGGVFPTKEVERLIVSQSDEKIIELYNKYKDDSKIRWKESIKKVVIDYGLM